MSEEKKINFQKIEQKWQKKWEEKKIFEVKENSNKKKYYVLDMFPYPSGEGLHIGHAFVFSLGDIFARFKRMQGYNVLYPIGYDALGLPAENAAIKDKTHPSKYTKKSISNFMKQQKAMGWSYDWSRMVNSSEPDFYRWDQWIFLKMLEKGIAYRKKAPVNWCPKCQTVLANEQVISGCCWRHEDTNVEIKHLEQWFFKITDYADELLNGLEKLDWPDRAKKLQRNWIGKSHGTEIYFEIETPINISNVIIVHGANDSEKSAFEGGRENTRHWFPWLRRNLEKEKISFSSELYPKDWSPDYKEWKNIFEKNKINEDTVLVGHSLGCAFILRWLAEKKQKVKKVILVAPYVLDSKDLPGLKDMVSFNFDNSLNSLYNELVVFSSEDDSPFILKSVKEVNQKLNVKHFLFKNKGHFTRSDLGTEEFPELLKEILSNERWPIFTTRPDTIYGVTFMVISAQHEKLFDLVATKQKKEVEKFLKKIKSVSQKSMKEVEELDKEGVFTGSYAINPMTKEKIPVYAGNFVIADYGSGMVMGVPAHDQRDFEFAKKYEIPIKVVIDPIGIEIEKPEKMAAAYTEEGNLINSGEFNGIPSKEAIIKITDYLERKKLGKKAINYKLRDWLISRQRYWGTPIPVVYCDKCGIVAFSEKDLPIALPEKVRFGKGNPLATNEKWINVKCPRCKGKARRETDTMDTFVNSSWYYLRYCDSKNDKKIFDSKKANYWCPINQYIGGPEHITMHLIYIRFYTKFLRDLGLLNFDEPALGYFTQGIVHGSDGEKMSKSRGNIVEPFGIINKFGADTLRMALVSFASPDKDSIWNEKIVFGSHKFLNKVYDYFTEFKGGETDERTANKINKTIKEISIDIEEFKHNLVLIKLRELFNFFCQKQISKKDAEKFLKMIHIYCPHITEELWEKIGNKGFISLEKWPECDERKINEMFDRQEEAVEKLVQDIFNIIKIVEFRGEKKEKVYVYVLPGEKENYNPLEISKRINKEIIIFAVNDTKKYDPKGISKKSKPGKPGIYLE